MTLNINILKLMPMGMICSQLIWPEFHKSSAKKSLERGEISIQKTPFGQNLRDSAKIPQSHFLYGCLCKYLKYFLKVY